MAITVNVTTQSSPVTVDVTPPAAAPVTVNVVKAVAPVALSVSMSAAPAITINVTLQSTPVSVEFQEARDAYQLALAEGFVGTRAEWLESLQGEDGPAGADGPPGADGPAGADGPPGANAEIVMMATLAAYLALAPEVQMDGRWYVIPK